MRKIYCTLFFVIAIGVNAQIEKKGVNNFWSDSGIKFLEYGFKNLSKEDAFALLDRISAQIDKKAKLTLKKTESNIYFSYQDVDVVITNVGGSYLIKLFWNGFESTWSGKSFENARKKIDKIISKR